MSDFDREDPNLSNPDSSLRYLSQSGTVDLRHPARNLTRGIRIGWLRVGVFMLLDAGLVSLGWFLAKRVGKAVQWLKTVDSFALLQRNPEQTGFLLPILVITLGMIAVAGLYGERSSRRRYLSLVNCLTLSQCLLVALTFLYQPGILFSRSTFLLAWFFTLTFVLTGRLLAETLIMKLRRGGTVTRPIALMGYPDDMEQTKLMLHLSSQKEFEIIESIDLSDPETYDLWYETLDHLYFRGVGEIFVCSWKSLPNPLDCYWSVKSAGLNLRIVPIDLEIPNQYPRIELIGKMPTIRFSAPALVGGDFWLKRCFDLIASVLILLLASPLYLVIIILIKLDSPGAIFYKQQRVGLRGKPFKVWKFRTMVSNADRLQEELEKENVTQDGVLFKIKDDPRITKVGRFLRLYSLDEIPQVINVLMGNMSLVGPRPLPLRDVKRFEEHHHFRHNVMPGITGLWQVSGRSDITDFEDAFKLDIAYIENWSLALDFQILLKTIKVVLGKEGAY